MFIAADIKAINVDSLSELERILSVAQAIDNCANVTLRIIPEIKAGAVSGWETGTLKLKIWYDPRRADNSHWPNKRTFGSFNDDGYTRAYWYSS